MRGRRTGLAELRIREGNVIRVRKSVGHIVCIHLVIVGTNGNGPFLQLSVSVFCPDIGISPFLKADIGTAQGNACSCSVTGIRFDIQMLAHDQPLHRIQLHIERILAGCIHGIGDHHPVVVVLYGIFIVNQLHGSQPDFAAVYPGGHPDSVPLPDGPLLQLPDGSLDPVGAFLLNGNIGGRISLAVRAVLIHCLNPTGYRRRNGCVLQELLCLFQLCLLGFQIQFRFFLAHLKGLNLYGILQLHIGPGLIPVPLQFTDLNLIVIHAGTELLPLQIQLVRSQLQLVRIVGKEGIPLFHILTFLNQQFCHILVGILFDFGNVLRNHHAGEALPGADSRNA